MSLLRLDAGEASLVVSAAIGEAARVLHLGARLPDAASLAGLADLISEPHRGSQPDDPRPLSLVPTTGFGLLATPALAIRSPVDLVVERARALPDRLEIDLVDPIVRVRIIIDTEGAAFRQRTTIIARDRTLPLDVAASLTLPLPDWAQAVATYTGRWAGEFRLVETPIAYGVFAKETRGGRPGFDGGAFALIQDAAASETRGRILALALAWSGDNRFLVERRPDGASHVQMGLRLDADEIVLAPNGSIDLPEVVFAFTTRGRNGVRRVFHPIVRARAGVHTPRKVHFNTWEAVYFDLDEATLKALADEAAALGAERFVLDDGWFRGRTSAKAALGDWSPDPTRFPEGLAPLIAHVKSRGMEFGLWVEPEMVSPDSDLYRAHPEWAIAAPDRPRPTQRAQLVLDLSRADVRDHLVATLDGLLAAHPIAYLKWDHNRELFPAARGSYRQTRGLYDVLDRLRARHPHVEIESCASGGGRVDLGVLSRTQRVWISDNTDATERLRIQRDASVFLPPALIGAHVGSSPAHITGRRVPTALRTHAAVIAHMGLEADPRRLDARERAAVLSGFAIARRHGALIAEGAFAVCETHDPGLVAWVVSSDAAALALFARTDFAVDAAAAPIRLVGLDPAAEYRVTLLEPWPGRAAHDLPDADDWRAGRVFSGAVLTEVGLRLPLTHPGTAWLAEFTRL